MPSEQTVRIVAELARRGYNADREAVTLLARAPDRERAIDRAVETAPDDTLVLSAEHVRHTLETSVQSGGSTPSSSAVTGADRSDDAAPDGHPNVSGGGPRPQPHDNGQDSPVETGGSAGGNSGASAVSAGNVSGGDSRESSESAAREGSSDGSSIGEGSSDGSATREDAPDDLVTSESSSGGSTTVASRSGSAAAIEVSGDIQSTGTGEYGNFVSVFRDRYERLADLLSGRVNHRPAGAVADLSDGSEAALVGMVADVHSTSGGHWRFELEDTSGAYPCLVLNDREFADQTRTILHDEVIAVEGRISKSGGDDEGILFVDELHVPDVPRTHSPATADRQVRAALVSDIHVGSQEFLADAWGRFADWLHTDAAADVEYLLVAGDMVEGVGVYPGQDEELDIVDIYDQYERFSEHLKDVPGDMEIVMIPGNHDAVRLAEPQPAFNEELRDIMSAHDATISANPSMVTVEGVSILMYHGVSLDDIIAELPDASYEAPAEAMTHLLQKRHLAPQYGGQVRIAPEERDHLVIDEVPDIFHAGHVHKFGYTRYRGVLTVNSSCWQSQTDFQASVNLEPDVGYAPVVDLQTLELQYGRFV